jgi:hypothetical protein
MSEGLDTEHDQTIPEIIARQCLTGCTGHSAIFAAPLLTSI